MGKWGTVAVPGSPLIPTFKLVGLPVFPSVVLLFAAEKWLVSLGFLKTFDLIFLLKMLFKKWMTCVTK